MGRVFRLVFLALALSAHPATATSVVTGDGQDQSVSAGKSILYGALLGAIVAMAAATVPTDNRAYVSAFFVTAGSAGGLGYYFLHSPSPTKVSSGEVGVKATLFSWNF